MRHNSSTGLRGRSGAGEWLCGWDARLTWRNRTRLCRTPPDRTVTCSVERAGRHCIAGAASCRRPGRSGHRASRAGDHDHRPYLEHDVDDLAARRQRVPDLRGDRQELDGGEEEGVAERVDVAAAHTALEDVDETVPTASTSSVRISTRSRRLTRRRWRSSQVMIRISSSCSTHGSSRSRRTTPAGVGTASAGYRARRCRRRSGSGPSGPFRSRRVEPSFVSGRPRRRASPCACTGATTRSTPLEDGVFAGEAFADAGRRLPLRARRRRRAARSVLALPAGRHQGAVARRRHRRRSPSRPGRALGLDELVLYELHVGTFTEEGTFDAAIPHLARAARARRHGDRADAGRDVPGRARLGLRRRLPLRARIPPTAARTGSRGSSTPRTARGSA